MKFQMCRFKRPASPLALALGFAMATGSLSDAIFYDGFECPTCPPPPPADPCEGDPMIAPEGFTLWELEWEEVFQGALYPNKPGYPSPIGSFSIRNRDIAGNIIVIPIAPTGPASLTWVESQPIAQVGYFYYRPAEGVLVAISNCPGDVRAPTLNPKPPRARTTPVKPAESTISRVPCFGREGRAGSTNADRMHRALNYTSTSCSLIPEMG